MKKICILLALILALASIPAMAAEGDALLGISDENTLSFNYCFSMKDTLYLISYGLLYTYHIGDGDLTEVDIELPEDFDIAGEACEYVTLPFAADDKLYSLNLITEYSEYSEFKGATLTELTPGGDGTLKSTVICDVDWNDMVEFYEDNSYPIQPDIIIGLSGYAYARYYDSMGDYRTMSIDLATGTTRQIDELVGAYTIASYKDGSMLAEMYNPETDTSVRLVSFNPADGSMQTLAEIEVEAYSPLVGLAYDPATDTIYCLNGGEICPIDLQSGTVGEGVTEMPLESYSAAPGCIMDGSYFAFCAEGAAIRNLDPAQKAQSKLKISDSFWADTVNSAYYRYANAHGDVSVVLTRDYTEVENLIENMMNHEDKIDVYVLSTSSSVYEALHNRGYLMELDSNEKVKALADSMYPSLRELLSTDGHLVAVPVSAYGWCVGINGIALEKLGMKMEDVPDNWSDFLDFLAGLKGVLTEDSGVTLIANGYTEADLRYELLNMILTDYQYYVNTVDPSLGYDSPLLRGLLEKLEQIDFVALGCAEESDEEVFMLDENNDKLVLLQTNTGCTFGNFFGDFTPVLMHVASDAPAYLVLDCTVIVINPYTKNPEAALDFIGEVVDNLGASTRYCFNPDLSEPVRGAQNQATLDEMQAELEGMRSEYEAAEADEKQSLEQEIKTAESDYEYAEANSWEVAPRELEWYRAHDDNLIVSIYNWLYPDTSAEGDDSGISQSAEASDLMDQYLNGQISLDEMLSGIDRKVQMRRLEGN